MRKENVSTHNMKTIGIVSAGSGEGVTTLAIGMVTYLNCVKKERTAIAMMNGRKQFGNIAQFFQEMVHGNKFTLKKVDYHCITDEYRLSSLYSVNYDSIVMDFGAEYHAYMDEFLRCSVKIVMGSVNAWRYEDYKRFCRETEYIEGNDRWLHIVSGDKKDIKRHLKEESLIGMERIDMCNPFRLDERQLEFFQKII